MFDQTIRQLLSLFPRGATDDQLIWRLSASGIRLNASELLEGLTTLAARGEIVRDSANRWQVPRQQTGSPPNRSLGDAAPDSRSSPASSSLIAVDATWHPAPTSKQDADISLTEDGTSGSAPLPEWKELLGYYAATLRKDPRGKLETFADRHGSVWQLLRMIGAWWSGGSLSINTDLLPAAFVRALSRRNLSTPVIGWPITVVPSSQGPAFLPAFMIPVEVRIEGKALYLDIEETEPALNPLWTTAICRHTSWKSDELVDHLIREGEDNRIGSLSDRLDHALGNFGGRTLRPADLATEISTTGIGMKNAAALFLPEESNFTKAAAADLESMRAWTTENFANSALATVLSNTPLSPEPGDDVHLIPASQTRMMTSHQVIAAESALHQNLTVLQGPPGSGKSEVIFSLLVSAVHAGKSVLFASRNHQAIDEVENRLNTVVPDTPVMIRARDAAGERDISFLDALSDLAHGDVNKFNPSDMEAISASLRLRAKEAHGRRQRDRRQTDLHLELCELAERCEILGSDPKIPTRNGKRRSLFTMLSAVLRRLAGKSDPSVEPLPENASLRQILRRMTEIRNQLEPVTEPNQATVSVDPEDASLARDVATFFPKLVQFLAKPDREERFELARAERELRFANAKGARQMLEQHARKVLRHRPIWAATTLSVPSRVPLVPGLFDYVIFDETSQCDIASALPLLARAKKAVVVGDPMQLTFVKPLATATEHALMDAAGFPKEGRSTFAQSINSLFDFCNIRPAASRFLLADQFRSAPAIVNYLNAEYYKGELIGRREEDTFRTPKDYRPGLAWDDVTGQETRSGDGPVNRAEAAQVLVLLKRFLADASFSGTVGVISPFNGQVAEIQKLAGTQLTSSERDRLRLRISTIDKFQGGEADIILLSLVLAANSPQTTRTFLQRDRRRFNVAVSRARALCILVGDLGYARCCGIKHIEFLADRASRPWSPPRRETFESIWERRLSHALIQRGLNPLPQHPVGTRYLDLALCNGDIWLDVEVDGERWHKDATGKRKTADHLRDREMMGRGWKVLRFWVYELRDDMEKCVDRIERTLGCS